ncbi:MAG: cation diffusion facilitator family transporter, partial [Candidatus Limnocylindria bacterium]
MTETVPVPSGHHHSSAAGAGARRLGLVLVLVVAYLVVEVVAAILTNSLALLADAGHMLTDAAGIGLALLAIWFAQRPATPEKSFGYYRVEIFAAIANAIILFGVAAYILYEAVQRLAAPPEVVGLPMLVVAVVGLVVNLISMRLLHTGAQTSLNLRGAYLEVVGDLLGS